ncbi:hypothetical protein BDD12DRAFT_909145 [Trichophaea hybrida]|nr:hypothetical protein BDD12DRAFT_909145 [Trichophaea hybrida]
MSWSFGMLWRVFGRIVKDNKARPICVMIDALDKCNEETRSNFLNHLQYLLRQDDSIHKRLKVIITSRPHVRIDAYLPGALDIPLDPDNLKRDIIAFVAAEVNKLPQSPEDLLEEVQNTLIRDVNGMFLWISLILEDLQKSTTSLRTIREKLNSLPKTLPS